MTFFTAFYQDFTQSLRPFPGRWAQTWRIAALCALMAGFAMLYEIPESAISCYLILYLMKPDAIENMVICVSFSLVICLLVFILFILIILTVNHGLLRIIAIFTISYFFVYFGARFQKGEIGTLMALILAFLLSVVEDAPGAEIITRGVLYAALMSAAPLLLVFLFNLFLGKRSQTLIKERVLRRVDHLLLYLHDPSAEHHETLRELFHESGGDCDISLRIVDTFRLKPRPIYGQYEILVRESFKLLAFATQLPNSISAASRLALISTCEQLKLAIETGTASTVPTPHHSHEIVQRMLESMSRILKAYQAPSEPPAKPFNIDVLVRDIEGELDETPDLVRKSTQRAHYFAFKITASALICYFVYNVFDWQGIYTAMITCYVVSLGTTAETKHKLFLRISGCLVGSLLAVIAIIYIIPNLSSVDGLMALVFIVILLPAWITSGTKIYSYGGVQIGLAFLLTVLNGFAPATDLAVTQDRILGILLGNVVCYFMFTHLWPVSLTELIEKRLTLLIKKMDRFIASNDEVALPTEMAENIVAHVNDLREKLKLVLFDLEDEKLSPKEHQAMRRILANIELLTIQLLQPQSPSWVMTCKTSLNRCLTDFPISREFNGQRTNVIPLDRTLQQLLHSAELSPSARRSTQS